MTMTMPYRARALLVSSDSPPIAQRLGPVQHDRDIRWGRTLDHEKPFAIWRHIIRASDTRRAAHVVVMREQSRGCAADKRVFRLNASQRPSREISAFNSLNGVWRSGST